MFSKFLRNVSGFSDDESQRDLSVIYANSMPMLEDTKTGFVIANWLEKINAELDFL